MRFAKFSTRIFALVLTVFTCLTSSSLWAQCPQSMLLCTSADDTIIRIVNADTLMVESTFVVPTDIVPGNLVTGLLGIALNPATDQVFVLAQTDAPPPIDGTNLVEVNLDQQFATFLGPTSGVRFTELTFNGTSDLMAIASDFAFATNAYCELNQLNGSATDLCAMLNGVDAQGIAFNPIDGEIYHAAGTAGVVFERLNTTPGPQIPCGTTNIGVTAPLSNQGHRAVTYQTTSDTFIWAANDAANTLYSVTDTGVATAIGSLTFVCSGMTERVDSVPCPVGTEFIRGDVDGNGAVVGLIDALFLLSFGFVSGSPAPPCMDGADVDADGTVVSLIDGIALLSFAFVSGSPAPTAPFPDCGAAPPMPVLSCDMSACP